MDKVDPVDFGGILAGPLSAMGAPRLQHKHGAFTNIILLTVLPHVQSAFYDKNHVINMEGPHKMLLARFPEAMAD
ncbi:hypothetical protein D3C81_2151970 [compost metagenome]